MLFGVAVVGPTSIWSDFVFRARLNPGVFRRGYCAAVGPKRPLERRYSRLPDVVGVAADVLVI